MERRNILLASGVELGYGWLEDWTTVLLFYVGTGEVWLFMLLK